MGSPRGDASKLTNLFDKYLRTFGRDGNDVEVSRTRAIKDFPANVAGPASSIWAEHRRRENARREFTPYPSGPSEQKGATRGSSLKRVFQSRDRIGLAHH